MPRKRATAPGFHAVFEEGPQEGVTPVETTKQRTMIEIREQRYGPAVVKACRYF